jgi:outer membrane protein
MCRRLNKKRILLAFLISSIFICSSPLISLSSTDQKGTKKGTIIMVDEKKNFVFINLGDRDVEPGDRVEIFRDSEQIGSASVKRVMSRMSEASLLGRMKKIAIGDKVVVTKRPRKAPPSGRVSDTFARLREKMRELEEEKPPEIRVEERLKALEEAEDLAQSTFKAQISVLEESEKEAVEALDRKLTTLTEKKEKTQVELGTKISSLKHAKESIEKGFIPPTQIKEDTIYRLESKLGELEKAKKERLAELKKEIEALEEKKTTIEKPLKRRDLKIKADLKLDEIEEELKSKIVRYELPDYALDDEEKRLTIAECISVAVDNHMPLEIAKKQLNLAEMRVLEAMRKMGPTVSLKWEGTGGKVSRRYYDGQKYQAEVKQPLFYGGELFNAVKQAKVNVEIVRNDYNRVKNDLVLQVKKAYYNLDKAEKALGLQRDLMKKADMVLGITKKEHEAGVIAEIEFLKVSSQHNQVNFQATSAREDAEIANLILQQAMNVDYEISIVPLAEPVIVKLSLEDCFELAYLNRPEIIISKLSLEHYEYEKKIMEARAYWPRVDFIGMYGNAVEDNIKQDITGGMNPRQLGPEYYFGTTVSVPVFGSTLGYSFTKESWQPVVRTTMETESSTQELSYKILDKMEDHSSLAEAELEYMRSQDDMNKRKQEVSLEVKEVFFKYKKALFMMEVAQSKLHFQAKQVHIMDIRRELGEVNYSDVLDEMTKLAEEEYSYVQAISDYYIAIASLNKAVGLDDHFEI